MAFHEIIPAEFSVTVGWCEAVDEKLALLRANSARGDCAAWALILKGDREFPWRVQRAMRGMGSLGDITLENPVAEREFRATRTKLEMMAVTLLSNCRLNTRG